MSIEEQDYAEEAQDYERTPKDFEADFDVEDTKVPDYPVVVDVDGMGKASATLASWELIEEMQEDGQEQIEFTSKRVAKVIRDHYRSPDFSALRGNDVKQMHLATPDNLLEAIMPGMSAEMQGDGSAMVDTKN